VPWSPSVTEATQPGGETRAGSAQLFPPDYRASGLLLHVTSLPSPYGIGDLGAGAVAWIDHLHDAGQGWWQSLPLGPTGYLNSPYQPMSSFAGNGLLVSPAQLVLDGLLTAADCACDFPQDVVDYDTVIAFRAFSSSLVSPTRLHRIRVLNSALLALHTGNSQPCHEALLPATVYGRATAPSEFLTRLLIKDLAFIRFGIRPAPSRSGRRHAPVQEM
jgi:4-alpha-glucanotransferase